MANDLVPVNSRCNTIVPEYGYQMGYGIGRAELRQRLAYAEQKLADYLSYDIAPRYRTDTLDWPRGSYGRYGGRNSSGESLSVRTEYGYVQAVGVETLDTIQDNASVAFTKTITPSDTFSVNVVTTVTNPYEIAVYFANTDRYDGSDIAPRWRIQPITVSISGGIATITGPAWLIVKPSLFQSFSFTNIDPSNNTNFAATLDIVRRYTSSAGTTVDTSQGTFIWETSLNCGCSSAQNNPYASDPAAVGKAVARVGIRDATIGIVTPGAATYSTTSNPPQWMATAMPGCTPPDRVQVRYLAGVPLVNGQMSSFWAEIVCMLTLAELPGPICACAETNKRIEHWQFDLARSSGNGGEQFAYIASEDLANPFGTRRGHVEAWKRVRELRNLPGIGVG